MAFSDQQSVKARNRLFRSRGKCSLPSADLLFGPVVTVLVSGGAKAVNLSDPAAQMRSLAALLAKKYACKGSPLTRFHEYAKKRELTEAECLAVFGLVGWKW